MPRKSLKNIHRLIETAKRGAPIPESFLADLGRTIARSQGTRKPSQAYKPSSMTCIRNMYFQIVGAEMDEGLPDADFVGICESGTARHEYIQNYVSKMKKYDIDCEYVDVSEYIKEHKLTHLIVVKKMGYETKLKHTTLNISFLCDGIIKYKGKYYILEIKTEASQKWYKREGVDPKHFAQATTYSLSLEIDDVMFLYENRNLCGKKVYILHVTDDMKNDLVISKIEACDEYVRRIKVPPMPVGYPNNSCNYCKYKRVCSGAGG